MSEPDTNTISILCVDDEPLFLDAYCQLLEREGFSVTPVATVAEAFDRISAGYYDVISADYAMPDMDGLTFLKEIRLRGCQSLFVIVTAKRLAHISIDAINAGADYYIQKGSEMIPMVHKLAEFIRKSVPEKNAGREIEEWERFYKSVVEHHGDLILRIDPQGTISFVNEAGVRFFGREYGDLLEHDFFSRIPAEERTAVVAHLKTLSPMSPDALIEHRVTAGNNNPVLLQWNYHAFFDPSGVPIQFQVSGREIARIVRVGAQEPATAAAVSQVPPAPPDIPSAVPHREEPADWNGLVETLNNLDNPVFAIDRFGTIIAWNTALAQLTGIRAAAMIGKGGQEYARPFYGKPGPMLIDQIIAPPGTVPAGLPSAIKKVGDTFIGDVEHVTIQEKPMLLWGKGSPVFDAKGVLIAAIEAITVGEPQPSRDTEDYLGGISSVTLKVAGEGVGGAIAGAIGSSAGGFGIYATNKRLFIIRNPDLNPESRQAGVQFGAFMMDELFGTTVDTRKKSIADLERLRVFETEKEKIDRIELKKPVLLSGSLTVTLKDRNSFRIYIDHKKAFTHIEQLMKSFSPDNLKSE